MSRWSARGVTCLAVLALLLAGCGGDGDSERSGSGDRESASIAGAWTVSGYSVGDTIRSVAGDVALTADFAESNVSGDGGCNQFQGPYETDGDTIAIGPLASTLRACSDPALDTQEQQYLTALSESATFRVTGTTLELLRSDGGIAVELDAR